jgi:hypothetical protein
VIGVACDLIADHGLLEQPGGENRKAESDLVCLQAPSGPAGNLRQQIRLPDDRAGDQVREEADQEQVVAVTDWLDQTLVLIDQQTDLLEREERNADRQRQMLQRKLRVETPVGRGDEQVQVLVVADRSEIAGDAADQQPARVPRSAFSPCAIPKLKTFDAKRINR